MQVDWLERRNFYTYIYFVLYDDFARGHAGDHAVTLGQRDGARVNGSLVFHAVATTGASVRSSGTA